MNWYSDVTEFSDFLSIMLWTNLDQNAYISKISIVLSIIRKLKCLPIAPSVEKLHAIKEMMVIYTFGVEPLDWSSECFIVCCVSKMYDYINLHLNDNSTQINQSIVFKFSDHKANIYP